MADYIYDKLKTSIQAATAAMIHAVAMIESRRLDKRFVPCEEELAMLERFMEELWNGHAVAERAERFLRRRRQEKLE